MYALIGKAPHVHVYNRCKLPSYIESLVVRVTQVMKVIETLFDQNACENPHRVLEMVSIICNKRGKLLLIIIYSSAVGAVLT